ncbi:hypothetical protein U737_20145 [Methylomonas sp. LW13]|uniref:hypothetical protein n=1 Tax=Methylomonas sp. Kb3 TaxID=1611544 RepID=UPI00051C4AA6|nr:hypothetical protein [Methylomonas sp. Kb3]PKD38779.1 hypothetical protein CWO84_17110 [Methylomonas sp. Kb3]QBC29030.1 hypothetical protein U737_20145 [Methylomonas sp. LW13]
MSANSQAAAIKSDQTIVRNGSIMIIYYRFINKSNSAQLAITNTLAQYIQENIPLAQRTYYVSLSLKY